MARKEKNIHYIYKTTCNVNGKYYVGMHSTVNENDGYMGSGLRIRRSIRKYGIENHTKEILEYCDTRELLVLREIEIVTTELISDGLCMNLCVGGQGGFISLDGAKKGGKNSINNMLKKMWTDNPDKYKGKLSKRIKLLWNDPTYLSKMKNREDWSGKSHTEETKQLMVEQRKNTGTGETNSQFGTCWITNGIDNKKIIKGTEIPENWRLGRVT